MRAGFSNRNFDTVMVMDAILISLACLLIVLVYREISGAPTRHARELAHTILAVTDDLSGDEALPIGGNGENGPPYLARRLAAAQKRVGGLQPGASLILYSDHPLFGAMSSQVDPFRQNALEQARAGARGRFETVSVVNGKRNFRLAEPLVAGRNCERCAAAGYPPFANGDVIGIREASFPIGEEYGETIRKLLYACGLLAAALMVFLGLIIPVFKSHRQERAQISDLAQSLEKEAVTDPLTGLHNRRYFERALDSYLREFKAQNCSLGLLIMDLDHFKRINDRHGHDSGDLVLKEVALRLNAITRQNDVVARIGGEEFAVITPYVNEEQLLGVAERYRKSIEALKIDLGSIILRPTLSVGIATNTDGEDRVDALFKAADRKLYEAKRNGRNRIAA